MKSGYLHWHKLLRMPTNLEITGKSPQQLCGEPFFLGGTERPGKWKLDSHALGERQDFIDFIILEKFVKCLLSADLDRLVSAAVIQREEVNAANALSQVEQKNYCSPGVMGIADTAKEEAEL